MTYKRPTVPRTCIFCGAAFEARPHQVTIGKALFCSQVCSAQSRPKKHGHTTHNGQSATYVTYQNMIGRCHREGHAKYPQYGAVGITVCPRWRESFKNFLEDMGERPSGTTIDRMNGLLGYFKENCRWATAITQQSNIKSNVNVTFVGRTQNVSAWAIELGFDKSTLAWRLRMGWSVETAFTTPQKLGNRTRKTGQVLHTYDGKTQCQSDWAREYEISLSLLRLRLGKGWDIQKALTTPKGRFVVKGDHCQLPANTDPIP